MAQGGLRGAFLPVDWRRTLRAGGVDKTGICHAVDQPRSGHYLCADHPAHPEEHVLRYCCGGRAGAVSHAHHQSASQASTSLINWSCLVRDSSMPVAVMSGFAIQYCSDGRDIAWTMCPSTGAYFHPETSVLLTCPGQRQHRQARRKGPPESTGGTDDPPQSELLGGKDRERSANDAARAVRFLLLCSFATTSPLSRVGGPSVIQAAKLCIADCQSDRLFCAL